MQKQKQKNFDIINTVYNYRLKKSIAQLGTGKRQLASTPNSNLASLNQEMKDFFIIFQKSIEAIIKVAIKENSKALTELTYKGESFELLLKPLDPINLVSDFKIYQNSTLLKANYLEYLNRNFNNFPDKIDVDLEIQKQITSLSPVELMTPAKFNFLEYFKDRAESFDYYFDAYDPLREFILNNLNNNNPLFNITRLWFAITTYIYNPLLTNVNLFSNSTSNYFSIAFYDNNGVKLDLSNQLKSKVTHYIPMDIQNNEIKSYVKDNLSKFLVNATDYTNIISQPYLINDDCSVNRNYTRDIRIDKLHRKYSLTLNKYNLSTDTYSKQGLNVIGVYNNLFILAESDITSGDFTSFWQVNPANYPKEKNYYYLSKTTDLVFCWNSYVYNSCFFVVTLLGILYLFWIISSCFLNEKFSNDNEKYEFIVNNVIIVDYTPGINDRHSRNLTIFPHSESSVKGKSIANNNQENHKLFLGTRPDKEESKPSMQVENLIVSNNENDNMKNQSIHIKSEVEKIHISPPDPVIAKFSAKPKTGLDESSSDVKSKEVSDSEKVQSKTIKDVNQEDGNLSI